MIVFIPYCSSLFHASYSVLFSSFCLSSSFPSSVSFLPSLFFCRSSQIFAYFSCHSSSPPPLCFLCSLSFSFCWLCTLGMSSLFAHPCCLVRITIQIALMPKTCDTSQEFAPVDWCQAVPQTSPRSV